MPENTSNENNKNAGKKPENKYSKKYKNRKNFYRKKNNQNNQNNQSSQNNQNRKENEKIKYKSIEEQETEYLKKRMKEETEKPICPICKEPIYIIEEAIHHKQTGELAHFECILKTLKEENENDLNKEEKIVYLGSGTFGIIQERPGVKNGACRFFVRKRINYEDRKVKKIEDDIDPEEEELFNV